MAKPKTKTFETGDLVRYTTNFLRSTGQYASKRLNGIVVGQGAIGPYVLWNDREMPSQVNAFNLEKAKTTRTREDLIATARGVTQLPIGVGWSAYRTFSRRKGGRGLARWEEAGRSTTYKEAEDRSDGLFQTRGTDTVVLDPNGLVVATFDTFENPKRGSMAGKKKGSRRSNPTTVKVRKEVAGTENRYEQATKAARQLANREGRPMYVDWSPYRKKWIVWELGGRDDQDAKVLFGNRYMETLVEPRRQGDAGGGKKGRDKNPRGARTKAPSKAAVDFFYEHAGFSYPQGASKRVKEQSRRNNAKEMARAEKWAKDNGYTFKWEHEEEDWSMFLGDVPEADVSEILWVAMVDPAGNVVQSLGGVMFGHDRSGNDSYVRVVEAELASEELDDHEKRLSAPRGPASARNLRHRQRNSHDPGRSSKSLVASLGRAQRELLDATEATERYDKTMALQHLLNAAYWTGRARGEEEYAEGETARTIKADLKDLEGGLRKQWATAFNEWMH